VRLTHASLTTPFSLPLPSLPPSLPPSISPSFQPDGCFTGDEWGEVDTRFSYCALSTLALLGRLSLAGEGGREGGRGLEQGMSGVRLTHVSLTALCRRLPCWDDYRWQVREGGREGGRLPHTRCQPTTHFHLPPSLPPSLPPCLPPDLPKANAFVGACRNFDGGFGCVPGAESHAGQVREGGREGRRVRRGMK